MAISHAMRTEAAEIDPGIVVEHAAALLIIVVTVTTVVVVPCTALMTPVQPTFLLPLHAQPTREARREAVATVNALPPPLGMVVLTVLASFRRASIRSGLT